MSIETFKDIRSYLGHTQQEMADWLGLGLATIALIETGQREVSSNIVGRLAHKFVITDDFLKYQKNKNKLKE